MTHEDLQWSCPVIPSTMMVVRKRMKKVMIVRIRMLMMIIVLLLLFIELTTCQIPI